MERHGQLGEILRQSQKKKKKDVRSGADGEAQADVCISVFNDWMGQPTEVHSSGRMAHWAVRETTQLCCIQIVLEDLCDI